MIENIYKSQNLNFKKLIEYVENSKSFSFNESSKIVSEIIKDELYTDKIYNPTTKSFDFENYPYCLDLLVLFNVKDTILCDEIYYAYSELVKYLKEHKNQILLSPILQYWMSNRPDINRMISKALKEIDVTVNEIYSNLISDIQDSSFIGEYKLDTINFLFSQISDDSFNFEIYKKIKEPNHLCKNTKGSLALTSKIKDDHIDTIFENYLVDQLEANTKFTKYFIQKYDYWISYYCSIIKEIGTDKKTIEKTKLSYILKIYNDICNQGDFNFEKTMTSKVLSEF